MAHFVVLDLRTFSLYQPDYKKGFTTQTYGLSRETLKSDEFTTLRYKSVNGVKNIVNAQVSFSRNKLGVNGWLVLILTLSKCK